MLQTRAVDRFNGKQSAGYLHDFASKIITKQLSIKGSAGNNNFKIVPLLLQFLDQPKYNVYADGTLMRFINNQTTVAAEDTISGEFI